MIRFVSYFVAASVIAASCSGSSEVLPTSTDQVVSTTTAETTTGIPANLGDSKNCDDFATYQDAKDWFDYYFPYYGDVANLDGSDNDGLPCESRPGGPST